MKNLFFKDSCLCVYRVVGGIFFIAGSIITLLGLFCKSLGLIIPIGYAYISIPFIPVGLVFLLYGDNKRWLNKRRAVEPQELQCLFSEVEMFKNRRTTESLKIAEDEIVRIKKISDEVFELEALPLRKALVDLYSKEELITKTKYELSLLEDYIIGTSELYSVERIEEEIEQVVKQVEDSKKGEEDENLEKLRSRLKILRETVAWYDKTWAVGECYIGSVFFGAVAFALAMLFVGILPLIYPGGCKLLSILHWLALGFCGASLAVLVSIGKLNVNEVGNQEGKQILLNAVGKIVIGGITAVLLYAALSGKILAGNIFPELSVQNDIINENFWINTGLSIFWGIFGGFSLGILAKLSRIAESAFGKEGSDRNSAISRDKTRTARVK